MVAYSSCDTILNIVVKVTIIRVTFTEIMLWHMEMCTDFLVHLDAHLAEHIYTVGSKTDEHLDLWGQNILLLIQEQTC